MTALGGRPGLVLLAVTVLWAPAGSPPLRPEAVAGWHRYVSATERRMAAETAGGPRFLASDFMPDATARRRVIRDGDILIDEVEATDGGARVEVPSAMVHHWRGVVFVPGASLPAMLAELGTGAPGQEDVVASRVLRRTPETVEIFLRLQRRKFVTVVYDTEHVVTFARLGPRRAISRSEATRIVEVANPGAANERSIPPGEDRGFLWRWNAYWRYEEVEGGVTVECESVSLSRDVPTVVRAIAGPLIRSTARESMERTLSVFRTRFRRP